MTILKIMDIGKHAEVLNVYLFSSPYIFSDLLVQDQSSTFFL